MRYLGIDYGKRKVGLAISEGISATPFKVLKVTSLKDALNKVTYIIEKEDIDAVVIGLAESGEALKITEDFIKELEKITQVMIVEETLTSKEALNKMIQNNLSRKSRQMEDAYSAEVILQNFLDSQND